MDREAGIKAIIELQALVGIAEPYDVAAENWDNFTNAEKTTTLNVHKLMCPQSNEQPST